MTRTKTDPQVKHRPGCPEDHPRIEVYDVDSPRLGGVVTVHRCLECAGTNLPDKPAMTGALAGYNEFRLGDGTPGDAA